MLSFDLAGGEAAAAAFVDGLECFTLAESLGGVESLVAHPTTMTHASMDAAARRRAGIGDGLLRLSVGIEALEDLRADIEAGLERAARVSQRGAMSKCSTQTSSHAPGPVSSRVSELIQRQPSLPSASTR
jgi:cystathionine gamma-synthase